MKHITEASDEEKFEIVADALGAHPDARNHEVADSGEYETMLVRAPVEEIAETALAALNAAFDFSTTQPSRPHDEYQQTHDWLVTDLDVDPDVATRSLAWTLSPQPAEGDGSSQPSNLHVGAVVEVPAEGVAELRAAIHKAVDDRLTWPSLHWTMRSPELHDAITHSVMAILPKAVPTPSDEERATSADAMRDVEAEAQRLYMTISWELLPAKIKRNYRLAAAANLSPVAALTTPEGQNNA